MTPLAVGRLGAQPPALQYVKVAGAHVLNSRAVAVVAVLACVPVGVSAAVTALPCGTKSPVGVGVGHGTGGVGEQARGALAVVGVVIKFRRCNSVHNIRFKR